MPTGTPASWLYFPAVMLFLTTLCATWCVLQRVCVARVFMYTVPDSCPLFTMLYFQMLNGSFTELVGFSDPSAPKKPDLCAAGQSGPVQVRGVHATGLTTPICVLIPVYLSPVT